MDPLDYLRVARWRWRVIAATAVLGVVIAFVLSPGGGGGSLTPTTRYQATHLLSTAPPEDGFRNGADPSAALNQASIDAHLRLGEVPERVAAALDSDEAPEELAARITATTDLTAGTVSVTATARGADVAKATADAFAVALLQVLDEEARERHEEELADVNRRLSRLETEINQLTAQLQDEPSALLQAQRDALGRRYSATFEELQELVDVEDPVSGLTSLRTAVPIRVESDSLPVSVDRGGRMVIGAVAGLLMGLCLALVVERVNPRVNTPEAAERAFGLPVIAEVPRLGRRHRDAGAVTGQAAGSPVVESYRLLRGLLLFGRARANLVVGWNASATDADEFAGNGHHDRRSASHDVDWRPDRSVREPTADAPAAPRWAEPRQQEPAVGAQDRSALPDLRAILVTSAAPSEGKSTVVASLAAALAEADSSVVVMDFDFHRPRLHECFNISLEPGISDVVYDTASHWEFDRIARGSSVPGVQVATSGRQREGVPDVLHRGRALVAEARTHADIVLLDTAPLLLLSDASELLPAVDAVILVARAGRTTVREARATSDQLARLGAPVLGVVLLGAAASSRANLYYRRGRGRVRASTSPVPAAAGTVAPSASTSTSPPARSGADTAPSAGTSVAAPRPQSEA